MPLVCPSSLWSSANLVQGLGSRPSAQLLGLRCALAGALCCLAGAPCRGNFEASGTMSFGKFLVDKHSKIVAVVFPASIAFGCLYTMKHGTNPFTDLRSWATGARCGCKLSYHLTGLVSCAFQEPTNLLHKRTFKRQSCRRNQPGCWCTQAAYVSRSSESPGSTCSLKVQQRFFLEQLVTVCCVQGLRRLRARTHTRSSWGVRARSSLLLQC